ITSPRCKPACSAALPACTWATTTPAVFGPMLSCARVSSSIALTRRSDRTFRGALRPSPASGAAEPGSIQIRVRPSDAMLARGFEPAPPAPEAGEVRKAPLNVLSDLRVKAIDEETRAQLNIGPKTAGVVVAHVQAGSAAEQAGLQRGDVIQEINRQAITGLKDFEAAAAKIKKDENAVLLVSRQGNSLFIVINP